MSTIHRTTPPRVMTPQAREVQRKETQKAANTLITAAKSTGSAAKKVVKDLGNNAISNVTAFAAGAKVGYDVGKHTKTGSRIVSAIITGFIATTANQVKTYADNFLKLGDRVFGGSN